MLIPSVVIRIPDFSYSTREGDTLKTVSTRFGISLQDLTGSINVYIADLFDPGSYLDIPHLVQFRAGPLIAEIQRSLLIQHLSGMVSRYYLHGLRLPTDGITPHHPGMWVRTDGETRILPPKAGLFALTGQQFPLPTGIQDTKFTFTLKRSGALPWLLFQADDQPVDQLSVSITPGSVDALRIKAATDYALANRLDTGLLSLGPEPVYQDEYASFPLTAMVIWQSSDIINLPYGTPPSEVPDFRLWNLPEAMQNLTDPETRAVYPRFKIQTARFDEATGSMVKTPVSCYGWATNVSFTIKKIPGVPGSPATKTSYEIAGADAVSILLMERLLGQIQGNDPPSIYQLIPGYSPNQTGDSPQGVQTDPVNAVIMGIAQVNLSTETRPPADPDVFPADGNFCTQANFQHTGKQGECPNI